MKKIREKKETGDINIYNFLPFGSFSSVDCTNVLTALSLDDSVFSLRSCRIWLLRALASLGRV